MSRLFDDAQSEYLQVNSPVVTDYPFAMSCWINSNDLNQAAVFMWVGYNVVAAYYTCILNIGTLLYAYNHTYGSPAPRSAVSSGTLVQGTWHHITAVFLAANERHIYLDGGNKGSDYNAVGGIGGYHNATAIGAARDSTPGNYVSGNVAEAAAWDLTAWGADNAARELNFEKAIASMAKGFTPAHFPLGLKAYWPLVKNDNDVKGAFNLTPANTPSWDDHCRIINPQSPR